MPQIGFGVFRVADTATEQAVLTAIDARTDVGRRHPGRRPRVLQTVEAGSPYRSIWSCARTVQS
jgi:hypothetical protein